MSYTPEPNPYQSPQAYGDVPRRFPLGAMSLGDILSRAMNVLFARMAVLFLIGLVANLPSILLVVYAGMTNPLIIFTTWYGPVSVLLSIILGQIASAAVLKVVEQEHVYQRAGAGEALAYALSRALPLIVTSIVYGLVIFAGMLLLIIPGIIFAVMYVLAPQACVLERLGPIDAMNRSQALTQGFRWRIFGILLLLGVLNAIIGFAVEFGLRGALPIMSQARVLNGTNLIILRVVPMLINIVLTTYASICVTLIYFDLRVRKEGFDVAVAATAGGPSPLPYQ